MKIFILTMEDPVYTIPFIEEIIKHKANDIIGLAVVTKGDRLTIGGNRSKTIYLLSLLIIMGPFHFIKYVWITLSYKLKAKIFHDFLSSLSPSIIKTGRKYGIHTIKTSNPNDKKFLNILRALKPDVIINQSQSILKKELLAVPKIGTINRHNALLPKNRGRLTPFWVLYKSELETGVSIHFVEEGIDSGDIIVQEKFTIDKNDDFNSIVKKNYKVAPLAMLKALDTIETDKYEVIPNNDDEATYNTVPSIMDAIKYRWRRIVKTRG